MLIFESQRLKYFIVQKYIFYQVISILNSLIKSDLLAFSKQIFLKIFQFLKIFFDILKRLLLIFLKIKIKKIFN
ncbi:hypothetical protein CJJ23_02495 [Mycoplasmopsis agassizii]|uniref:Uncharacterized protein n=1 Tax=Mycoplasmopsis agassizii TaxID=33922 RepID=A0A269TJ23_9BACT|nr:hypothetical protein CJJ23_02495 [Mycoplasmopsis agassizii]